MAKNEPYIGVDLGGTNIQAGVVDQKDKLLSRDDTKTKADQGPDAVIKRIGKLIDQILEQAGLKRGDVGGLGIGAPGAINVANGVVINAVNLRWTNFPLAEVLTRKLKLPVVVDNDVNVGTWGEFVAGAGRDFHDMLGLFVGTGIGGGLVFNDQLFYGANLTAGEIGHTVIDGNGRLGRRTLENLASRTAVANLLQQLIRSNHPSLIPELTGGDLNRIRSKILAEALERKDPLTDEVIADAARYVGIAIANAVTLLSLPCAVVGGGVTEALGRNWIGQIRRAFEQTVFPAELARCRIVASELGDDAGVVGSAALARDLPDKRHRGC